MLSKVHATRALRVQLSHRHGSVPAYPTNLDTKYLNDWTAHKMAATSEKELKKMVAAELANPEYIQHQRSALEFPYPVRENTWENLMHDYGVVEHKNEDGEIIFTNAYGQQVVNDTDTFLENNKNGALKNVENKTQRWMVGVLDPSFGAS